MRHLLVISTMVLTSLCFAADPYEHDPYHKKPSAEPSHSNTTFAPTRPASVETKVECKTIEIDKKKTVSISYPQGSRNTGTSKYKVMMHILAKDNNKVNSAVPSWEEFSDYQAAKDFKDFIKEHGRYELCTFTPPTGARWQEVVITQD